MSAAKNPLAYPTVTWAPNSGPSSS